MEKFYDEDGSVSLMPEAMYFGNPSDDLRVDSPVNEKKISECLKLILKPKTSRNDAQTTGGAGPVVNCKSRSFFSLVPPHRM